MGSDQDRRAPATGRVCGDQGVALVEFALVFPVMVALLLGLVSGGMAVNTSLQLTHAAREGARYGASIPTTQSFTTGTWATNVRDVVIRRGGGELTSSAATVCVALVQGSPAHVVTPNPSSFTTNGTAPCDATETYPITTEDMGRRVQVRVTAPVRIETGFASWRLTVTSSVTAKSETDE